MKKYFIYYSLSGNGDYLADIFKNKGYEIVKVETLKTIKKPSFGVIMKFGFLAGLNKKTKIKQINVSLEENDEVVIGSPIWNDRLSTPINTVLNSLNLNKETTKFLLYPAGKETKKSFKQLEKLGFKQPPLVVPNPLKYKEEANELIKEM